MIERMNLYGWPTAASDTGKPLPGGAVQVLKAARATGDWFCWTTCDSLDREGVAEPRTLVKGRASDGRAFVAWYRNGKVESVWVLMGLTPAQVSVTQLKKMLGWSTWLPRVEGAAA